MTFRYNMTIWLLDTTTMLLALTAMLAIPDYFELVVVVTVLVTCGLNPALYILGSGQWAVGRRDQQEIIS